MSADRDVIETARASSRLARAVARVVGGPVTVHPDLLAELERGLVERIVALLQAARRAGQVVAGEGLAHLRVAEGYGDAWLDAEDGEVPARPPKGVGAEDPSSGVRVPQAVLDAAFGRGWPKGPFPKGPWLLRRGRLTEAVRNEAGRLAAMRKTG